MIKRYVQLSRLFGSKGIRKTDEVIWELLIPVHYKGSFKAPSDINRYFYGFVFQKYMENGECILINEKGGWNTLHSSDIILNMTDSRKAMNEIIFEKTSK